MTEPTSTGAAAWAGGIMVAGIATGLPADLIFPGFVGSLWALRVAGEGGAAWRVLQVIAGTLTAAWFAEPVSLVAGEVLPWIAKVPHEMRRYPLALLIGWGGLSIGLAWIGRYMSMPKT